MTRTVAVIGGGVIGIFSALYLSKKGHEVYLIEKENELGGLLNSISHEEVFFDYGTHIINNTLIEEIDDLMYEGFQEEWNYFETFYPGNIMFNKLYQDSSYIYIPNEPILYERALVQLLNLGETSIKPNQKLKETLYEHFGGIITEQVFRSVLKKLTTKELEELTTNVFLTFDLKRVIVGDDFLTRELKKSSIYDSKIAYPKYSTGKSANKKMYPKYGGIKIWIKELTRKLQEQGVKILYNNNVKSLQVSDEDNIEIYLTEKKLKVDKMIWSLPYHLYENLTNNEKTSLTMQQKNEFRHTLLLHYIFDRKFLVDNQYINCWDNSAEFFRITIYPNMDFNQEENKCTVEIFFDEIDELKECKFEKVKQELINFGIIDKKTKTLKQYQNILYNSFPILIGNKGLFLEERKNVEFVGKGRGTSFFINSGLIEAYNVLKREI